MSTVKSKLLYALVLLLFLLAWVFYFGRQYDYDDAAEQSQLQAKHLSQYINSELNRFAAIPTLVSRNPLLNKGLGENTALLSLNQYLSDIQRASGASDLYILDTHGTAVASSNWRDDHTFIGSNFSFRYYFKQAMLGQAVADFALGTRSQRRGIYLAAPITQRQKVLGVVVIKVNADKFEADRLLLNASGSSRFYIKLEDDVIAMSDVPKWRLNSFKSLTEFEYKKINESKRYLHHQPVTVTASKISANSDHLVSISGFKYHFVSATEQIERLNAEATVLVDISKINIKQLPRLFWFSVFYVVLVFMIHLAMVRFAGYKKLLFSSHSLEQEVIQRTMALEKAHDALVQAAKLATVGQLSAGINHEINQPLSAMNTYLVSAKRMIEKGHYQQAQDNIVTVQSLIARVHKIVSQLKHFSKPSQMQLRPHSLVKMIDTALMISQAQLKQDDVIVEPVEFSADICVKVDSVRFEQVLVNVITNASQAMANCQKRRIRFQLEQFDSRVKLSILDSGEGIEQQVLASIFEPFYSTKSSLGLGLGLSISKHIIESFNGRLTAHNHPDGGAEFIITVDGVPNDEA